MSTSLAVGLSASFFALGFWARWFFYRSNTRWALSDKYNNGYAFGFRTGKLAGMADGEAEGWNMGREYEVAQQLARRKKRQDAAGRWKKIGRSK